MKKIILIVALLVMMVAVLSYARQLDKVITICENANIVASGNSTYTIDLAPYDVAGFFSIETKIGSPGSGVTIDYGVSNKGTSFDYTGKTAIITDLLSTSGTRIVGFPTDEPIPCRYIQFRATEALGTGVTGFYLYLLVVGDK